MKKILVSAIALSLFTVFSISQLPLRGQENQPIKSENILYDGHETQATKNVIVNHIKRVFPEKGERKDWLKALEHESKANDLKRKRNFNESILEYKKAIEIYPYDPEIFNSLAICFYVRGKKGDLHRGEIELLKAIELKPTCMFYDNLAKGLYEQKKYKEALEAMEKALPLSTRPEKTKEIKENIDTIKSVIEK